MQVILESEVCFINTSLSRLLPLNCYFSLCLTFYTFEWLTDLIVQNLEMKLLKFTATFVQFSFCY